MAETEKLRYQSTSRACIKAADTRIKLENRRPRSPNGTPIAHTECKEDSEKSDNIERKPGCLTDPDISGSLKICGAEGLFSKANLTSTFKEPSLQSVNSRNTAMERPIFISSEAATSKQSVSRLKANFEQGQEFLDSSHKQHITEFTNPLHRGNKQRFQGGSSTVHSVEAVNPPIAPKPPSPAEKTASPVKKPLPPLAPKPASPARKPDSSVNDKPTSDLKCVNQGDLTNRKPLQLYEEIPSTLLDSKEHQLFIDKEEGYSTVVHINNKTTVPSHPPPRQLVNTCINVANINKQLHESPSAEQETEKEKESEKSTEIPVYAQVNKKKPQTLDDEAGSSKIPVYAKVNKPKSKTLDSSEGESSNIPVYAKVNKPKSKTLDSTCNVESPTVRETRSESDPTPKNASVESKTEPKVSVAKEEPHNMDKDDSMKDTIDSDFDDDDGEPPWDSDEFDDESDFDDNKDQDSRSLTQDGEEDMVFADEKSKKLYNIAKEILTTERAYVRRLHLLDQVFYFRLENECLALGHIPQEVMHDVFSNISAIHKLHKDFFLPKLEERMSEWSTNNKIGDILKTLAPFLKLYTAYIANFDKSSETLATWTKKSPKFAAVIEDIQKSSECENLTLGHHMLEPIQRVPRYKLLLKDYLSKLPEDSPDYKNCQDAMEIISEAAAHANDSMKKMERFKKLLELQDRLLEGIDLITASRVFIKEGDLTKVAARSSTGHQERTLLLFNDILLCCAKVPGTNKLKVKVQMDLDGMEIGDADEDVELSNTFRVTSKQKVIDFSASTEEDKDNWTKALQEAIQELIRKRESYKRGIQSEPISECDLGKKAPAWVRDEAVTMCMSCDTMFTLTKRRHHCRACGAIFCNGCCNAKAALEYAGGKQSRVCLTCYNIIVSGAKRSVLKKKDEEKKTLDVRKIDSQTKVLLSGYLKYKGGSEKNWVKRWCVLSDNFVFYCYKAKKDTKAAFSIPLPGYVVDKPNLADDIDRKIAFKIHHKNMVKHFFAPDGEESLKRWMQNLSYAVKAEQIPEEGETTNEPKNKEERRSSIP